MDASHGGAGPVTISGFADEIDSSAAAQIAGLRAARVGHVDVRGVDGTNVLDLTDAQAEGFGRQLADAGIGVACIGSPIGKVQIGDDPEAHFERFGIALRRAGQLGCDFVRVFSFYHAGQEAAAARAAVVAQLRRMADAAGAAGLMLVHENEKGIYGDTPARCRDLLDAVDHPHLAAAFDPANFVQCGCRPAEAWELLADRVVYFHIKDAVAASGRVVPAGHGDGEVAAILGAALRRGYAGFLAIEPHLKADDPDFGGDGAARFIRAVAALRQLLERLRADETPVASV